MLRDEMVDLDFEKASADLLGQLAAVDTLVTAVGSLNPPACVALNGAWGSGKTTVMHNAMRKCRDRGWIPVWFDPWEYDRQPDLLQPLLRALLLEMRRMGAKDPARWDAFKKTAGRAMGSLVALGVRVGLRVGVNALVGPIGGDGTTPLVTPNEAARMDVESWLDGDGEPPDEIAAVKLRFKELVDAALALLAKDGVPPEDARVVFFLDDLDRCLPDRVVELIEGVKLLLCGETGCKAMFVFALDRAIVGEAIRQRFPGSTGYTGENYLEKIFDLSLEAPPVPGSLAGPGADVLPGLERFVEQLARGLPRTLKVICEPLGGVGLLMEVLSEPVFANPRVIKRTLNRLHLLTAVEARRQELSQVKDRGLYRRYLMWVAGAERFRQFRHFVRRATGRELLQVKTVATAGNPGGPPGALGQVTAAPGFASYFAALGLMDGPRTDSDRERVAWSQYVPKNHRHTLRWFDDVMRSAGV